MIDKSKLRKFLFMKDKQEGIPFKPVIGSSKKSPIAAPSLPSLPKPAKFGKTKNYFKK